MGLMRVLVALLLLFLFFRGFFLVNITRAPYTWVFPLSLVLLIVMIQVKRSDFRFLRHGTHRVWSVFLSEYLLLVLPLLVLWLVKALWWQTGLVIVSLMFIVFLKPAAVTVSRSFPVLAFLPAGMFEWQAGLRKAGWWVLVLWLAGFVGIIHIGFSIVSMILLTITITAFYSFHEPVMMLFPDDRPSHLFLIEKLLRHALFAIFFLGPAFLSSMFHEGFRMYMAFGLVASLNLIAFSILFKYYHYRPGRMSQAHPLATLFACLISLILPAALIVAFANIFLFSGAIKTLKPYLHA
jgi:hypothetical protein